MTIDASFFDLVDKLSAGCRDGEQLHASLLGETSDFIRFNHNRIRQAGHVQQYEMQLSLVEGQRHCIGHCELSGHTDRDRLIAFRLLDQLRQRLPDCPDDPYINYNLEPINSKSIISGELPDPAAVAETIITHAEGLDLVGHYAAGEIVRAYCNTLGQRNCHKRDLFNFDWSCHGHADKAVKAAYAGSEWQNEELAARLERQQVLMDIMQRPARRLSPGKYRAYLAPSAMAEIMFLIIWEGFSLRALRTRQSPLLQLAEGERRLDERITITDERASGLCPGFSDTGFALPDRVELIRNGRAMDYLVDARSSREYQCKVNAGSEISQSLDMAAGELAVDDILTELDTGLYISNLWYGNFSDRNTCRITGMTRYACLWVEGGVIQAPVEAMRYDDSIYRMLGEHLVGLTREREFIHDPHTYERRSLASMHLPGALIKDFRLTL